MHIIFHNKNKGGRGEGKEERKKKNWEKESCGGRRSNILNKWVQNVNFIPVF